jgi:hypothetical protein
VDSSKCLDGVGAGCAIDAYVASSRVNLKQMMSPRFSLEHFFSGAGANEHGGATGSLSDHDEQY